LIFGPIFGQTAGGKTIVSLELFKLENRFLHGCKEQTWGFQKT